MWFSSVKVIPEGDRKPVIIQVMAWHRIGNKPFTGTKFYDSICHNHATMR